MRHLPSQTIVVSHTTALRAIRVARRRYAYLPWRPLDGTEQQWALDSCAIGRKATDLDALHRLGLWDHSDPDCCIDVLSSNKAFKRTRPEFQCHVVSSPLPAGSILEMSSGIYTVAPAVVVAQYAHTHDFPEVLALIQELCGTFSLPEDHRAGTVQCASPETESPNIAKVEPALRAKELLRQLKKLTAVRGCAQARFAARCALDGARSPGEAIMASLYHAPFARGGFNIKGLLLNYQIDFSDAAQQASSMPYAVCDAFVGAARATLEYNGSYHEQPGARLHDDKRAAGLEAMGITTIVINREQLRRIEALESIARLLYRRAGMRYRNRTSGYGVKQIELLNGLRTAFGWPAC